MTASPRCNCWRRLLAYMKVLSRDYAFLTSRGVVRDPPAAVTDAPLAGPSLRGAAISSRRG